MATTVAEAINRTRRLLRDFGATQDALTASVTSSSTTLTVADASTATYTANWAIEVDNETMLVVSGSGTSLTVRRGYAGSTAASHASGATVLIRPAWYSAEIVDGINEGIHACYPLIYKAYSDTSLTTTLNTYEYTVPTMPSDSTVYLPFISRISLLENGDYAYRDRTDWDVVRSSTPKIRFRRQQPQSATIRVEGYGPFPDVALGGSFDAQWPRQADMLPSLFSASQLLVSGEAGRLRFDQGVRDDREQSVRVGASVQAGTALENRFRRLLDQAAMPPMPPHVVSSV